MGAEVNDVHVRFIQDKIDTMEKVFRFAVVSMVRNLQWELEKS